MDQREKGTGERVCMCTRAGEVVGRECMSEGTRHVSSSSVQTETYYIGGPKERQGPDHGGV